jgi:DME family drug/metabolite transporter
VIDVDARLLALFTAFTFGLAPVAIKHAYEQGGTTGTGLMLQLLAAVAVNVALIPLVDPRWEALTPAAVLAFVLGGLSGNALGRRWSFVSVQLLGASRSSAIRGISPLFTAIVAAIAFQETVTLQRWAAIGAIVVGAVLVTWQPGGGRSQWLGTGVLYALGAALGYGLRPVFVKYGLNLEGTPMAASLIGSLAALAWVMAREDRKGIVFRPRELSFWYFLASAFLGAAGMASLFFAVAQGDLSFVYPLSSTGPLFAVVFTFLFLKGVERLTWRVVAGSVLIVAGVLFL